jgi:uncharacterized protein
MSGRRLGLRLNFNAASDVAPRRGRIEASLVSLAFALDRSTSSRWFDQDGRLHCTANISRAAVNPYLGREVPDFLKHRLDPDRLYKILRVPGELARAAPSFDNLPVLSEHYVVSADDPQPGLVVGASGSDAEFDPPFLRNSLVIWRQDAIDDIVSGRTRELSCAYRFDLDLTGGRFLGQPYDGVIRNIVGSHIALVEEGRAGPDCAIDEAPRPAWLVREEERLAAFRRHYCVA